MRLLLVDNLAAHYWPDRAQRPPLTGGAGTLCGAPPLTLARVHAAAAAMLPALARRHRLAVLATRYAPVAPGEGPDGRPRLAPRDMLPAAWHGVFGGRLVLQTPPAGSAEEREGLAAGGTPVSAQWQGPGPPSPITPCRVCEAGLMLRAAAY